ncbi:hypothetical protein M670_01317 [Schinkia azotoformans MEV2011]|uniref:Uncharacterized protein n=1 Tax=Schinkia azotoformans MEV2011 TaxID=1348973 RepID=A0A072NPF2_SCHAZ|nr:hypothetical protein [Schinkia azotoformans]KEF39544.1 hypothetical protein M670_01317 [Schinkia azotoformans MEV2011]MEC1714965.1 hypothetical protein [Schinkia azotoformans]MEC1723552.1 hypothetical protein [Schinkia azotoformans]MEC1740198.1 hypothetical protein [Schinkia azotoformans]MEC1759582.1 hypothetical protein [Schinkia azotoformans]
MGNEKLRTINKLQITSLVLTIILTFVPTVGHDDFGKYFGVPLQSLSYHEGRAYGGVDVNMWTLIANFFIIYFLCKMGLKVWMSIFKKP